MILHAGIRPFIVSLLFLIHPGKNHPLPPEKRLTMTKKSCQDSVGNVGMCMFKYDCIRQKGITLATCVDGFLFGACCMLKSDNFQDENKEENNLISEPYGFVTGMDFGNTQKYQKENADVPSKNLPPFASSISSEILINFTTEANTPSLSTKTDKNSFHGNESIAGIHFSPGSNLTYALNGSTLNPSYVSSSDIVSNSTIGSTMSVMITNTENEKLHGELRNNSEANSTSINFSVHGITEDSKYEDNNSSTMFTNTLYTLYSSTEFTSNSTDPSQEQTTSVIQRTTTTDTDINPHTTHFVLNEFEKKSPAQKTSTSDVSSTVTIQTDSAQDDHDGQDLKPTVNFSDNAIQETAVRVTELLTLENIREPFTSELEMSSKGNYLVENSSYERTGNDSSTFDFNSSKSVEVKPFSHSSMQWSTEPAFPESLQSLIAQLTSLEVSSPLNLTYKVPEPMVNNLQTFETQNLPTPQNESAQIFSNDKIEIYEEGENFNEERNSTSDQQQTQITTSTPNLYEAFSVTVTASNQYVLDLNESITHIFEHLNESTVKTKPAPFNYTLTKTSSSFTPVEPYENETTLKTLQAVIFSDSTLQSELFNSTYVNGGEVFMKTTNIVDTFPTNNSSKQCAHKSPPMEEIADTTLDLNSTDVYTSSITLLNLNGTKMLDGVTEPIIYENSSSVVLINNHDKKNFSVAQFADQNVYKDIISVHNISLPEDSSAVNRDSIFSFTVNNILEINDSTTEEIHLSQTENLNHLEKPLTLEPVFAESTDLLSEKNSYLPYTESKITSHDTLFLTVPSFGNLSVTTEISKTTINDSTSPFELTTVQLLVNGEKINNSKPHNSSVNANITAEQEEHSDVPDYAFSMKPIGQTTFSDFIRDSISTQSISTDNTTKLYSYTEHDPSRNGHLDHITTSVIPEYQNISTLNYLNLDKTPNESMYELHKLTLSGSTNATYAPTDLTTPYTPAPELTMDMKNPTSLTVPTSSPENNSIAYAIELTSHIKYPDNSSINPATAFTIPSATSSENNSIIHATEFAIPPTTFATHNIEATIPAPTSSEHVSISYYGTTTVVSTFTFPENTSIVNTTTSEPIQTAQFLSPNEASETNFTIVNHQYEDSPGLTSNVSTTSMTSIAPYTSDKNLTSQEATTMGTTQITTQFSTVITYPDTTTESHRWNYKKDCGVRLLQPLGRIVGGKNSYYGKWPWQALVKEATWLGLFIKNKCGGVLITAKYVLTAAHCQPGFFASLLVILGTHDLAGTFDNKASIIRNVKRMVVHRHYNAQTFENDLALLEMESKVEFLPHVVPICLPHRNEDFTGKMAFVTGWGKLTHGGDVPNILQEVQVPIVENEVCQRMFFHAGHKKSIRSNFVCAGYTNGGQDSCEGDSGGPLMVQREDKRWVLVGTVSHGIGCADPNLPGVYMRMSAYRPWIDSIIKKP